VWSSIGSVAAVAMTELRESEHRDDDLGHIGAALERAEEQLNRAREVLDAEEDSEETEEEETDE